MIGEMSAEPFAHSVPGRSTDDWETLARHLAAVAERAAEYAAAFGWAEAARSCGQLHDIGVNQR